MLFHRRHSVSLLVCLLGLNNRRSMRPSIDIELKNLPQANTASFSFYRH